MIVVNVATEFHRTHYIMTEMKPEIKAAWIKKIRENAIPEYTALDLLNLLYHNAMGVTRRFMVTNGFPVFEIRSWSGLPMDVAVNIYNMTNIDKKSLAEIASYLERDVHL